MEPCHLMGMCGVWKGPGKVSARAFDELSEAWLNRWIIALVDGIDLGNSDDEYVRSSWLSLMVVLHSCWSLGGQVWVSYQCNAWAEFCPISDFVHFQDLASRNSNFEPFGYLGKMLIFTFFRHSTRIKKWNIKVKNFETFWQMGHIFDFDYEILGSAENNWFLPTVLRWYTVR